MAAARTRRRMPLPFALLLLAAVWPTPPASALPLVDPGLFVILGVQTCREGSGYCLLGTDCTLDEDFLPDDRGGHCDGLRSAFTPSAHFICCRYSAEDNSTTATEIPGPDAARTELSINDDEENTTEQPDATTTGNANAGTTEETEDVTTRVLQDSDQTLRDTTTYFPTSDDLALMGDETTTEYELPSTTDDAVTGYETLAPGATLTSSNVNKPSTASPSSNPDSQNSTSSSSTPLGRSTEPTVIATVSTTTLGSTQRTTPIATRLTTQTSTTQTSKLTTNTSLTTAAANSATPKTTTARAPSKNATEPTSKKPSTSPSPTKTKPVPASKIQTLKRTRLDDSEVEGESSPQPRNTPEPPPPPPPSAPSSVAPQISAPARVSARNPAPSSPTLAPSAPPNEPSAEVTSPSRVSASDSTSTLNPLVTSEMENTPASAAASGPTTHPTKPVSTGNSPRPEVTSPSRVSASDATSVSPRSTTAHLSFSSSFESGGGSATGQDVLDLLTEGEWQINEVPDEDEATLSRREPPSSSRRGPTPHPLPSSPFYPSFSSEEEAETTPVEVSVTDYANENYTEPQTESFGSDTSTDVTTSKDNSSSTDSGSQDYDTVTASNTEGDPTVTNSYIEDGTVITESEADDDVQLRTLPQEPSDEPAGTMTPTTSTSSIQRPSSTDSSETAPSVASPFPSAQTTASILFNSTQSIQTSESTAPSVPPTQTTSILFNSTQSIQTPEPITSTQKTLSTAPTPDESMCGEYTNGTRAAGGAPPPTSCWLRQFVDVRTNEFVCHGAMVGRGLVATSAVCAISLHRLGRRRVRLRAAGDGPKEPPRRVAQIIVHESFRGADPDGEPRHDLGLVRAVASPQQLAQQQLLGRAACAACVAPPPPGGPSAPSSGCSAFAEEDGDNKVLQCRDVKADGDVLTATCSGSGEAPAKVRSGSPLVCGGALVGVASSSRGPASVFTSASELRPWLRWNMQRLRT